MADARINDFPEYDAYGDLAPGDYLLGYLSSVDKTVKIPLSALSDMFGSGSSSALSTPALSLVVAGDTEIDATWGAVTNATAYRLYRSETSLFIDAEKVYEGSALLFNDTGLVSLTQYFYWLQATGSGYADSGYSQANAITTGAGADTTPPVLSSIAVSGSNPNQLILTYNETLTTVPSATTTQWSTLGRTVTFAQISGTTVTLTFNTPFLAGQSLLLSYTGSQVRDTSDNLAATFTNHAVINGLVVSASQLVQPFLTATPVNSGRVDLSWPDVPNETGYQLQRSTDSATWSTIATTGVGGNSFSDTTVSASTLYYYRVKAVGDGTNFTDSLYGTAACTTPSASSGSFDTILDCTIGFNAHAAGVFMTASSGFSGKIFYFNAIASRTGTPMTMFIRDAATMSLQATIDFPSDYLSKAFKYKHSDGTFYLGSFVNGDYTF